MINFVFEIAHITNKKKSLVIHQGFFIEINKLLNFNIQI